MSAPGRQIRATIIGLSAEELKREVEIASSPHFEMTVDGRLWLLALENEVEERIRLGKAEA